MSKAQRQVHVASSPSSESTSLPPLTYPRHANTNDNYLCEANRRRYIDAMINQERRLPQESHRMPSIISLTAPTNRRQPIQFWQLFSVLGEQNIVRILEEFYRRVMSRDELARNRWFAEPFHELGSERHHAMVQAAMMITACGGPMYYPGGDSRTFFHHRRVSAIMMNDRGATRWAEVMTDVFDAACSPTSSGWLFTYLHNDVLETKRVRRALNEYCNFFMNKYAREFNFASNHRLFAERNGAVASAADGYSDVLAKEVDGFASLPVAGRDGSGGGAGATAATSSSTINLLQLSENQIKSLPSSDLRNALIRHGVCVCDCVEKEDLVKKALRHCC